MIRQRLSQCVVRCTPIALALFVVFMSSCQTATPPVTEVVATPLPELSLRGAGGTLRLLYWEAPTTLNPHLTVSIKDWEAARITYEPLASFDTYGDLVPFLAAEAPSLDRDTVAEDGTWVIWKLKSGIQWCDGEPFTAEDVKFTFDYVTNPDVAASSASVYDNVQEVEIVDTTTVRVIFKEPTPAWALPFVGVQGLILPQHVFEAYNGPNAQDAPANTLPVGTGPYCAAGPGIKPQEVLLLGTQLVETNKIVYTANPYFRDPDKPYFGKIELRGGGTVDEAARQVLQSGDADYAYFLTQVAPDKLEALQQGGSGELLFKFGSNVERILINHSDPRQPDSDGERSSVNVPHPLFSDKQIRQAFAYAINREAIGALFGDFARPTTNNLVAPKQYASPNVFYTYDPDAARALLEAAGWVLDPAQEIRVNEDGERLQVVLQAPAAPQGTALEQTQKIVQQNLEAIGVDVELKILDPSIIFSPDPATNPDNFQRFNADMQMFGISSDSPDPGPYMQYWTCDKIPQEENGWSFANLNIERWCNEQYDALYRQTTTEFDPDQRRDLFIQMNDLMIEDVAMIPLVLRSDVSGVSTDLKGIEVTPWDMNTWKIMDWRRTP